jgi:hypothetical protein
MKEELKNYLRHKLIENMINEEQDEPGLDIVPIYARPDRKPYGWNPWPNDLPYGPNQDVLDTHGFNWDYWYEWIRERNNGVWPYPNWNPFYPPRP